MSSHGRNGLPRGRDSDDREGQDQPQPQRPNAFQNPLNRIAEPDFDLFWYLRPGRPERGRNPRRGARRRRRSPSTRSESCSTCCSGCSSDGEGAEWSDDDGDADWEEGNILPRADRHARRRGTRGLHGLPTWARENSDTDSGSDHEGDKPLMIVDLGDLQHSGSGGRAADGEVGVDGGGRRPRGARPVRDIWQRAFAARGLGRRRRCQGRARGESCSTCGSDEESDIDREYGVSGPYPGGRRRGSRQPRQGDGDGDGEVRAEGELEGVQAGVGPAGDWADGRRRGPGRQNRGLDMGMRRRFPGFDMEVAPGVHVTMNVRRG